MENLKTRKMQVYKILKNYPKARNDDLFLYKRYLADFCYIYVNDRIGWLWQKIYQGLVMSFESVSRFRRMLQHEYPSLRGKMYGKRKKMIRQVQKDLGYNVK